MRIWDEIRGELERVRAELGGEIASLRAEVAELRAKAEASTPVPDTGTEPAEPQP